MKREWRVTEGRKERCMREKREGDEHVEVEGEGEGEEAG